MTQGTTPPEEPSLATYKAMVSKLNGWQLTQELAKRVVIFDRLTEELDQLVLDKGTTNVEEIEMKKATVEMQIEILHRRMNPYNTEDVS